MSLKEHESGILAHYDDYYNRFILDEQGNPIPHNECLCFAYEPGECTCDCTSWEGYVYE